MNISRTVLLLLASTSLSFAALPDFAGRYKGTSLTTFTESTPPTYNENVTVKVKSKGKGNAGQLLLTSQSQLPGQAMMTIAVKLARNGSGSATINNPGAGVSNLVIPWNAKLKGKKMTVISNFLLFGMFPTNIAMTVKIRGSKLKGVITGTRLDTGVQVITSVFSTKKKK